MITRLGRQSGIQREGLTHGRREAVLEALKADRHVRASPQQAPLPVRLTTPRRSGCHERPTWHRRPLRAAMGSLVMLGVLMWWGGRHAVVTPSTAVLEVSQSVWVAGVITGMELGAAGLPVLTLTEEGRNERNLQCDDYRTSVFQQGAVLSPAHLKIGQQVNVLCEHDRAHAIEIVRQPLWVALR